MYVGNENDLSRNNSQGVLIILKDIVYYIN